MSEFSLIVSSERDFSQSTKLLPGERRKLPHELVLITRLIEDMQQFVGQYAVAPLPINPKSIHLIGDLDKFINVTGNDHTFNAGAEYDARTQSIAVYSTARYSDLPSDLQLALQISHELLHQYSFYSVLSGGNDVAVRRSGLWANDKDEWQKHNIRRINEAFTEELNKRFDQQFLSITPSYSFSLTNAIYNRNYFRQQYEDEEYSRDIAYANGDLVRRYAYFADREKLNLLLDRVYELNSDQFKSREDVFKMFAQAYFHGNLLDLARAMQSTFGTGAIKRLDRIQEDLLYKK